MALARPPGASPRKKYSHGPSADFMEAWSRAVVRTLPAPPGVRPGRPAVAPLQVARGIQNKVLEAMAMARPIVCTSGAIEGIATGHGMHSLAGDVDHLFHRDAPLT